MFYEQFIKLCNKKGIKPTPLIKYLKLSPGNIKRWEEGSTVNSDILLKISEYFDVSIDYLLLGKETEKELTDNERELLKLFKKLLERDQIKFIGRADEIISQIQNNKNINEELAKEPCVVDNIITFEPKINRETYLYDIPVSAGHGIFLDSPNYEIIQVSDAPLDTSFAVRVRGDSMEPQYTDGNIIYVKQQPIIDSGQIGIFMLDGNVYIKKFIKDDTKVRLVSLNPNYKDKELTEYSEFRIYGKVVGKKIVD